jgi:hypothetical protein
MLRMVIIACVASMCLGQTVLDKDAKILKEQRFNAGDGRTGAAFATENGQIFREETDANGNRIGQYSYIGDNGEVFTVKYSAGKDGFRILEGSHITATGQDSAPFSPEIAAGEQPPPAPLPAPAPERRVPLPARVPAPRIAPVVEEVVDPNFNPFINPHDPTHRDFAFNKNGAEFQPKNPAAPQPQATPAQFNAAAVPNCADCAGVNPFINPFDASHQQGGLLAGHQAGFINVPAPRRQPVQPVAPLVTRPVPTAPVQPVVQDFPGQIKINRFETGFNFDFEA